MFDNYHDDVPTGALNVPDKRDYFAEHIVGIEDKPLPDNVLMYTIPNNQGNSVKCTTYSTYSAAAILNEIEHKKTLNDLPEKGWDLQTKLGTYTKQGDYVQTALKSIVKFGLHTEEGLYEIEGYAQVKPEDLKYWLSSGFPIVTSATVTKTNFKKAKYDGIWSGIDGDRVTGHAFALIGYEPHYFIALNSYGDTWGKFGNGTFKIKEEDVKHLDTSYILYDKQDAEKLFKDVTSASPCYEAIKWAKDNRIVKGYTDDTFRPAQPITRAEMVQVLYNYHKFNS